MEPKSNRFTNMTKLYPSLVQNFVICGHVSSVQKPSIDKQGIPPQLSSLTTTRLVFWHSREVYLKKKKEWQLQP